MGSDSKARARDWRLQSRSCRKGLNDTWGNIFRAVNDLPYVHRIRSSWFKDEFITRHAPIRDESQNHVHDQSPQHLQLSSIQNSLLFMPKLLFVLSPVDPRSLTLIHTFISWEHDFGRNYSPAFEQLRGARGSTTPWQAAPKALILPSVCPTKPYQTRNYRFWIRLVALAVTFCPRKAEHAWN